MDNIYQLGIEIILFFQGLGDWIFPPMQFFTFFGDEEFFLLVTPILYWCIDTKIGFRTAIMLMLSSAVYNLGKWLFHTPRPYWISDQVRLFRAESSFGMPSGHATSAVTIWGYLAASFRNTWFWGVAIALMVLIGFSRSPELGWQLVFIWVVINGGLAALGALLARGHPLTILSALVAAPITSLNPTIAAGMVTGLVESWLRKPRVVDLENLRFDITTVKGWFRNPATRILLVFFLSNLGSAIGTWVAGLRIFSELA